MRGRENVAVLSRRAGYHSYLHTQSYFQHHLMPYQPVKPLETPVKLTFPDGTELISSVDPVTNLHSVHCGLCGKLIKLGLQGAGNSIFKQRGRKHSGKYILPCFLCDELVALKK